MQCEHPNWKKGEGGGGGQSKLQLIRVGKAHNGHKYKKETRNQDSTTMDRIKKLKNAEEKKGEG